MIYLNFPDLYYRTTNTLLHCLFHAKMAFLIDDRETKKIYNLLSYALNSKKK